MDSLQQAACRLGLQQCGLPHRTVSVQLEGTDLTWCCTQWPSCSLASRTLPGGLSPHWWHHSGARRASRDLPLCLTPHWWHCSAHVLVFERLGSHRLAAGCCLAAGPAAHHTQTSWVRTAASLACASFMDLRPPLFTGALALQAFAHPPELPVLLISLLTPICNALLEILHLLYVVADVELSLHLSASA